MSESLRKLPPVEPRVETGAIQFGEDWTGLFIRGDNAFALAEDLELILSKLPVKNRADPSFNAIDFQLSLAVGSINSIIQTIRTDVIT